MAADMRRFTISITQDMESNLDAVKKESYCESTQSEMLRDLIARGLSAWKTSHSETT